MMARSTLRRTTALLAGVVILLGLVAGPALAHAALRSTTPVDGETVDEAPDRVTLEFNEPISAPTGGIRVFDDRGERIDLGDVEASDEQASVGLPADLGDGTYIVTWRAVSADGHPVKGAFVFSVGAESGVADDLVASLFGGGDETGVAVAGYLVRTAMYLGVLIAAGAAIFLLSVVRPVAARAAPSTTVADRGRTATWGRRAAVLGMVATVLSLPVQSMATTGLGPVEALGPTAFGDTLASTFGLSAGVRLVALAVAWWAFRRLSTGGGDAIAAGAGGVALLSLLLEGHTMTESPAWLMWVADATHLVTAAVWLAGLLLLGLSMRARRRDDDPVGAAALVARFSGVATWSIVAVTLAGSAMAWVTVRAPRALTTTGYGWTLLGKVVLVAGVVAIGAYNRQKLVPVIAASRPTAAGGSTDTAPAGATDTGHADADAAWRRLGRTVRVEVVGILLVLIATSVLVSLQPAASEAGITGAFSVYAPVGEDGAQVNLVVDPNRAGRNEIHLYALDRTGRPSDEVTDVSLELSLPSRDIGPIVRAPEDAGPGHWVLTGSELSIPGTWVIEIVLGMGRFEERRVEIPVTVNP